MVPLWDRAELCLTTDPERYAFVTAALKEAGLDWTDKVSDPASPHPLDAAVAGAYGRPVRREYRIFVRKKDLEQARAVLRQVETERT
jgi:hypothetical protein